MTLPDQAFVGPPQAGGFAHAAPGPSTPPLRLLQQDPPRTATPLRGCRAPVLLLPSHQLYGPQPDWGCGWQAKGPATRPPSRLAARRGVVLHLVICRQRHHYCCQQVVTLMATAASQASHHHPGGCCCFGTMSQAPEWHQRRGPGTDAPGCDCGVQLGRAVASCDGHRHTGFWPQQAGAAPLPATGTCTCPGPPWRRRLHAATGSHRCEV